jgi:hypothetical protein
MNTRDLTLRRACTAFISTMLCASMGCATATSSEKSAKPIALKDWQSDVAELGKKLATDGLIGLVHGANAERNLYVFEYNKPGDFFTRYYFSLVSKNSQALKALHRGDRIHIHGVLGGEKTPQPHILANQIEMIQAYDPGVASPGGHDAAQAVLPDDLKKQNEMVVQVHAVVADGQVLVVEYKDAVVPVIVNSPANEQTRDLFRGDIIRIGFELQNHPHQPTHVVYKPRAKAPYFDILQRLVDRHAKPLVIEGPLVLFPKSPVINQDIWAVEEDLGFGLFRYSTLVNFDQDPNGDMSEWTKLKLKLRKAWDAHPESVVQGRNKFINRKVRIHASGIANVVSPAQANAQLFLKAGDITVLDNN